MAASELLSAAIARTTRVFATVVFAVGAVGVVLVFVAAAIAWIGVAVSTPLYRSIVPTASWFAPRVKV